MRKAGALAVIDKRGLSERDICTKFITPALRRAGWDEMAQIREEVTFTKGRIIVRGKLVARGKAKRADYILYCKPNIPVAVIEAKDNSHGVGDGMQQALDYAETLRVPFAFSSNGDAFVFHDRTGASSPREADLPLDEFPSPAELWARYRQWKGLEPEAESIFLQDYHEDSGGKTPRYYQANAINAAVEAIAKGRDRILLVMATGTGKTYTAFQIIWRLWKAGRKKRILFLADRNVLVDQTIVNDFRPFGGAMAKLSTRANTIQRDGGAGLIDTPHAMQRGSGARRIDTAYEIYLGLYQAITGPEESRKIGQLDREGEEVEDRIYNVKDFDRALVIDGRTKIVAEKITAFLKESGDRFQKAIIFCVDQEHAARMRQALINENADLVGQNPHYVMRMTGGDAEGQEQLDSFIDPESKYPVLVTTSRLLSTGVDVQTCRLIVLDRNVGSMTEFKQIVGRGSRVHEDTGKLYFTLIDFRGASSHFADPEFDGQPAQIYEPKEGDPMDPPAAEEPPASEDNSRGGIDGGDETAAGIFTEQPGGGVAIKKIYVDGISARIVAERVEYLDEHGKLITESLRDFTRKALRRRFASLDDFLRRWNKAERKQAVIDEMEAEGPRCSTSTPTRACSISTMPTCSESRPSTGWARRWSWCAPSAAGAASSAPSTTCNPRSTGNPPSKWPLARWSSPFRTSCARMWAWMATRSASASCAGCSSSRSSTTRTRSSNCSRAATARPFRRACNGAAGPPTRRA